MRSLWPKADPFFPNCFRFYIDASFENKFFNQKQQQQQK